MMSATTAPALPEELMPATAQDIQARVHELLLRTYPPGPPLERRCDRRYPYPHLVRLTPLNAENKPSGESFTVVGKNLSERGMGFFHSGPIAHRRMIASFDAGGGRWLGLVVDVTWCRFICSGWYESGGRFLEAVPMANVLPAATVSK